MSSEESEAVEGDESSEKWDCQKRRCETKKRGEEAKEEGKGRQKRRTRVLGLRSSSSSFNSFRQRQEVFHLLLDLRVDLPTFEVVGSLFQRHKARTTKSVDASLPLPSSSLLPRLLHTGN